MCKPYTRNMECFPCEIAIDTRCCGKADRWPANAAKIRNRPRRKILAGPTPITLLLYGITPRSIASIRAQSISKHAEIRRGCLRLHGLRPMIRWNYTSARITSAITHHRSRHAARTARDQRDPERNSTTDSTRGRPAIPCCTSRFNPQFRSGTANRNEQTVYS